MLYISHYTLASAPTSSSSPKHVPLPPSTHSISFFCYLKFYYSLILGQVSFHHINTKNPRNSVECTQFSVHCLKGVDMFASLLSLNKHSRNQHTVSRFIKLRSRVSSSVNSDTTLNFNQSDCQDWRSVSMSFNNLKIKTPPPLLQISIFIHKYKVELCLSIYLVLVNWLIVAYLQCILILFVYFMS